MFEDTFLLDVAQVFWHVKALYFVENFEIKKQKKKTKQNMKKLSKLYPFQYSTGVLTRLAEVSSD